MDHCFLAVVSCSIADILRRNAVINGLLPVVVDRATHRQLLASPVAKVVLSLEAQSISLPDGTRTLFSIDPFAWLCLLNGLDMLRFILDRSDALADTEVYRSALCS